MFSPEDLTSLTVMPVRRISVRRIPDRRIQLDASDINYNIYRINTFFKIIIIYLKLFISVKKYKKLGVIQRKVNMPLFLHLKDHHYALGAVTISFFDKYITPLSG